jgi:PAS domain S-box-containing protein
MKFSPTRQRRERLQPRNLGAIVVVVALGVTASVLVFQALRNRAWRLFELAFDHRAHERVLAIEQDMLSNLSHIESIANMFDVRPAEREEFRHVSRSILEEHPALQGLGFNRVVRASEREAHEAAIRREVRPDYRITERAPDGSLVPAGPRDVYVAVTYLEPYEGNEAALGYDINSEPVRREALERARDTGEPTITGPITLVQERGDSCGVLICVPTYRGPTPRSVSERREGLQGYAVGVVRMVDLVDHALASLQPTGIHLRLVDLAAPADAATLHFHRSRTLPPGSEDAADYSRTYRLEIAGRRWEIEAIPTSQLVDRSLSGLPAGALVAGLLITAALALYLWRHTEAVERLRQADLELIRAEERRADFGRVLDESHDEVYVFHAETLRFLHVNRGALRNLGYSMDEMRERTPLDLKPRLNRESFAALIQPLRDGRRRKIEFSTVHRRKDGSLYDVEVHLQMTSFDVGPAFLAVILDISDRKRLEERLRQSQRLEALGTLAGGTAHDVNNLLTAIMGYTELCFDEVPPDSRAHRHLGEVVKASERARDVVRQILTFSRRSPFEKRPVDLGEVVGEALKLMRASLPATVAIREDLSGAGKTLGDPSQIHQVVVNLCTNAAHAMRGRDGLLDVRVDRLELNAAQAARLGELGSGSYARIRVQDNGHGIPAEVRDRIFDPFFTTKNQGEGTGMGLSVVHGIVKGHRGTIRVSSEHGQGTTFEVYLPGIEMNGAQAHDVSELPPSRGERILVVDDEPSLVELMREMLEGSGYIVETHEDGAQALESLRTRSGEFDLVITDYSMPRITGTTLARELGRLGTGPPVILVSGYGDLINDEEISDCGIRELLTKPLRRYELVATVRRTLDRAGEARAVGS